MQAAVLVNENGNKLSDPFYRPPVHWFPVKVPTTVLSGLVANKVYPNPYEGMNNMYIPDASDEFNKQYQLENIVTFLGLVIHGRSHTGFAPRLKCPMRLTKIIISFLRESTTAQKCG